jgi:hypothetical protein
VKFAVAGVIWIGIEAAPCLLIIAVLSALACLTIVRIDGHRLHRQQAILFGPHLATRPLDDLAHAGNASGRLATYVLASLVLNAELQTGLRRRRLSLAKSARQGPAAIRMGGGNDVKVQAFVRVVLRHKRHLTKETPVLITVVACRIDDFEALVMAYTG